MLEEQLGILECFAYRVAPQVTEMLQAFLERLVTLELEYQEVWGVSEKWLKAIQSKQSLAVKALKILEQIRYQDLEKILDIFLQHSTAETKEIAEQAEAGLKAIASYDIDLFYKSEKFEGFGTWPQDEILKRLFKLSPLERQTYFAERYTKNLAQMAAAERARAEESIKLRKFEYGAPEEKEE